MSVLLFVLSGLAAVAGIALVGFGIPISEFSFGNTLIVAGTSAIVGSLLLFALAVTVGRLQRILDQLTQRVPERAGRSPEPLETQIPTVPPAVRAGPGPGRAPFPAMPVADGFGHEFHPPDPRRPQAIPGAYEEFPAPHSGPSLRNPFDAPVAVAEPETVPLSPQPHPFPVSPRAAPEPRFAHDSRYAAEPRTGFEPKVAAEFGEPHRPAAPVAPYGTNGSGAAARTSEPEPRIAPQPARPQNTAFDAMWPAEPRADLPPRGGGELRPAPETHAPGHAHDAPEAAPKPRSIGGDVRPVAVLKSGMVDGMGYTLYVDGSIEADLPQGTVRFASINDLRNHLEKNS